MKTSKIVLITLLTAVTLTGASCGGGGSSSTTATTVAQAVLATGVKINNEPENNLEEVAAGTATLYLAAQINNPTTKTTTRVTWYKLPDKVVATETFSGERGASQTSDFDQRYRSSWLASRVEKPGASWPLGDYRAEVLLNSRLAKTVFFTVVSDSQADKEAASRAIQKLSMGDTITDENRLVSSRTTFTRNTENIYVQTDLSASTQPGTDLQVNIRYIKEDLIVTTFFGVVGNDSTLIFALPRERFAKPWADRLWPVGTFEVTVRVNGVLGRTANFYVRA